MIVNNVFKNVMEKLIISLIMLKSVYNHQLFVNISNMKMEYIVVLMVVINMYNIKNALVNAIMDTMLNHKPKIYVLNIVHKIDTK